MIIKQITAFFFLIGLYCTTAAGQPTFLPGYILQSEQDTVKGYLEYRSDENLAQFVNFKTTQYGKRVIYTPADIQGYGFDGVANFVAVTGETSSQTQSAFYEQVVGGSPSLYYLAAKGGNAFYIKFDTTAYEPLPIEKERLSEILKEYFNDCLPVFGIQDAQYSKAYLTKEFEDYNNCKSSLTHVAKKPASKIVLDITALFGMNHSQTNFNASGFEADYLNELESDRLAPSGGIWINAQLPLVSRTMGFVTGLQYGDYSFFGDHIRINSGGEIRNSLLSRFTLMEIPLMVQFNTRPFTKFSPFMSIGGSLALFDDIENYRIEELANGTTISLTEGKVAEFKSSFAGLAARTGLRYAVFRKHFLVIEGSFRLYSNFAPDEKGSLLIFGGSVGYSLQL